MAQPQVLHRIALLHALFSVWCVAQQLAGDERVILNLGYFATYAGSDFVSSGEGTYVHVVGEWLLGTDSKLL